MCTDSVPRTTGIRKDEKDIPKLNLNLHRILPFHQDWGSMKYDNLASNSLRMYAYVF